MNKLFFIVCLFWTFYTTAQWNDFGVRSRFTIEKRLNPRWRLALAETMRFNENATQLNQLYTSFSTSYRLSKTFSFRGTYRFEQKFNYDETIDLRHRLQVDVLIRFQLEKLRIELQERFQIRYRNILREENWNIPKIYFRPGINLEYDLNSKFTPYVSGEVYLNQKGFIDNLRFVVGGGYDFNKHHSIKLYYLIDKEIQVKNPLTFFIIGTAYKYSF